MRQFFLQKRFQSFISEISRAVNFLGENFIFLSSLATNEISRNFSLFMYIDVVLLINFPEQLNYASTLNVREVMKFYNPVAQSFEITVLNNKY